MVPLGQLLYDRMKAHTIGEPGSDRTSKRLELHLRVDALSKLRRIFTDPLTARLLSEAVPLRGENGEIAAFGFELQLPEGVHVEASGERTITVLIDEQAIGVAVHDVIPSGNVDKLR